MALQTLIFQQLFVHLGLPDIITLTQDKKVKIQDITSSELNVNAGK